MRRELIALLPVLALSSVFVLNQSCANKALVEEVEEDIKKSKENITEAKGNLKESKDLLKSAKDILTSAREKLTAHRENVALHKPPAREEPAEEVQEAPKEVTAQEETTQMGQITVAWCDTLWDISTKIYGNSLYWPAIYDLNKEKIGDDPWILEQGTTLVYKLQLTEEEKDRAVREAIAWDLKFKDRPRSPKCPPR